MLGRKLAVKSQTFGTLFLCPFGYRGTNRLLEQLICNQQVVGSNPTAGSIVIVISVARPGTGICISGVFLINPCP